jgi:hypothetical protein
MAVISSGSFAKALWPGVNAWYGKAYSEHPEEWRQLVNVYSSKQAYEEDVGISSFGLASVKPEGAAITYDEEHQAFVTRYTHAVYANGFIVTREMFEDDLYKVVGQRRAKGLAFSMRQTKETVVANIFNRAFNTSFTGGDGSTLVASAGAGSSNHPNWAGGTWTNGPTTSVDISEAALEEATIDIMKWTDDRGLNVSIMPKCIAVAPDNYYEVNRILYSTLRVGTSDNDPNIIKDNGVFPDGVKVNHYFTDTDAWFVLTNSPDGLKLFQRRNMQFTVDNDFDTENAKFKATERYVTGWTDPRCIWGSQGG